MSFIADLVFERGHTYLSEPLATAVAWVPPDVALIGPEDVNRGREIIASHSSEATADDALSTIMKARGHAIAEPHWTLQYLGVRPGHQASGVGTAAVKPMLAVCDAEQLPCGLVSTNGRNVPFYERLGFRVVAEVTTPDGVAVMRPMQRLTSG